MKKFLSLVLALVMTMSLVTVSAGAKDFTDDDKVNYEEAVTVMSEVKVLDGYADGSFKPQGELTRGAAAKIICNLILGPTTAAELHADTAPYKDVPVDHTFAGYIAYCAKEGIISGYADGSFRPAAPLTGYAFMKMLLGALGYDQITEGYTGVNWSINVAKQAIGIGLNKGLKTDFNGVKIVTREEAALYAFNTLKSTMVEYDEKTTINVGGAMVTLAGKAQDVAWGTATLNDGNIKKDGFVQFAEKHFPKLTCDPDTDDFGRPSNKWINDKKTIGTFVNYDLLVASYTEKVKGGTVYSDIGSAACGFDLTYWVDGVVLTKDQIKGEAAKLVKKNDDSLFTSGNGVQTEVFADSDEEELTIVEVHTYLAEATSDYNSKTEKLPLKVYIDINEAATPTEKTISRTLSADDFDIDGYEKGDFVLVNYAGKDKEIKIIADPEIVADAEITSYSVNGKDDKTDPYMMSKITAEGTKYSAAKDAAYDADCLWNYDMSELKNTTYNVILDQYGYVIGLEKVDGTNNYAFLVGYEVGSSYLAATIDKALVILIDDENNAEMKVVDARDDKMKTTDDAKQLFGQTKGKNHAAINKWITYEMDGDVMILKTCVDEQYRDETIIGKTIDRELTTLEGKKIDANNSGFNGSEVVTYGNAKTVYVAVDAKTDVSDNGSIVKINGTSVGIKNTSIDVKTAKQTTHARGAYVMYDGGYVKYAVVVGEDGSIADRLVYLTDGITEKYYDKDRDQDIFVYEGIVGGEMNDRILSEIANETTSGNDLVAGKLYVASYDADGVITEMEPKPDNWTNAKTATNKVAKYVQATTADSNGNGKVDAADTATVLELKGMTLYITAASNNHYVLLDDNCQFFIRGTNEKGKRDSDYQLYDDAENAMSVLGKATWFTGKFVAICDGETGYATTIIIDDMVYEHDADTPSTSGEIKVSGVKIGGKTVAAATGYSDLDDAIENAKTVYLSAAQLTAGLSDYTATSTLTTTGAIQAVYKVFADADAAYEFAPADKDNHASDAVVVSGKTVTVSTTSAPALGDGDLVIIRVNDDADALNTGNLTWFAYVVSEKID